MPFRSPASPLPGSKTIMVVDDVSVVRRSIVRILSEEGYRVYEAASLAEMLEVLGTARIGLDLVLTDVVMPEVNGVELARLIETQRPGVRILFMSAFPAEVLVREGLGLEQLAAAHFLAKPFTRDELLQKVQAVLRSESTQQGHEERRHRPPQS
jgi:CheY-like chemotaxis protein